MAAGAWTTEPLGTHTRRSKSMSSLRGLVVVGILVACICVLSTRVEPVAAGPLPMDDMYCGTENCYDILGVDQGASDRDIRRAYRKQSLKWHPDKNIGNTKEAEHMFVALADAYQVLSDPESRSDYDYYLDHPEEAMYNRYRYYYRSAAKTDWRWVVGISVSVASVFLYVLQLNKYNHAVAYYRRDPKTVLRANDLAAERARERGISLAPVGGKKANKKAKLEADAAMKKLQVEALNDLVAAVDIQGGYRKPGIRDVLCVRMALLPYTLCMGIYWYARWFVKFSILKHAYGQAEREYLTRVTLGLNEGRWKALEEDERKDYVKRELWIAGNKEQFEKDQLEDARKRMGDARFKQAMRHRKNAKPQYGAPE